MCNDGEVMLIWTKSDKEELQNLYYSPNDVRVTGQNRMRWAGH